MMFTDTKNVVTVLLVVLFIPMVLLEPSILDISYFCILFSFCVKLLF